MDHYVFSVLCLLCFHAGLFIDALWSPAAKELTSLHSDVIMSVLLSNWYPWVWYLIISIPDLCPLFLLLLDLITVVPRSHIHGLEAGLATDTIRHHSWSYRVGP